MYKKFTEEQYQKIVEIGEKYQDDRMSQINAIISFTYDIPLNQIEVVNRAIAIANPLTREWAHDKFVEKEKRYIWQSKQETYSGEVKRLYNAAIGIADSFVEKTKPIHNGNLITETEVKKWGYNPVMFDKEEA